MNTELIANALVLARAALRTALGDAAATVTSEARARVLKARIAFLDQALREFPSSDLPLVERAALTEPVDLAGAMNTIVTAAYGASSKAGWWTDPATGRDYAGTDHFPFIVATKLMLIVSEISEAMEGHRKGLNDDKLPHRSMIEVELADAVHRIADLAGALGCDLGGALVEKMAFNRHRADHKPGARMMAGGKAY